LDFDNVLLGAANNSGPPPQLLRHKSSRQSDEWSWKTYPKSPAVLYLRAYFE